MTNFYGVLVRSAKKKNGETTLPDHYIPKPSDNFVLCRGADTEPTAVYGWDEWDFNPYRLSARKINKIIFVLRVECEDEQYIGELISQLKFILYNLIYHNGTGKLGKLSATVIVQYYHVLRKVAEYCVFTSRTSLLTGMNLYDILSNPVYLNSFLGRYKATQNEHKTLSAIVNCLSEITEERLLFKSCTKKDLNLVRKEDNQHPVIPSRIYCELLLLIDPLIDRYYPHRENIKKLIKKMDDRCYGAATSSQLEKLGKKNITLGIEVYRPTMKQALKDHGLLELYKEDNVTVSRAVFVTWLRRIQYIAKLALHLYTGMRDQECARIMYHCLEEHQVSEPVVDSGKVVDRARMIPLISTTSKFTGYRKKVTWLAPDNVLDTVKLLQNIAEAIASLHNIELEDTYLFIKPSIIRSEKSDSLPQTYKNSGERGEFTKLAGDQFIITEDDLDELKTITPNRDFDVDDRFMVGKVWPITSHQFRRSLAFYACNSGFVSLDTVSTQFKQTSRMMAKYYGKGAEHLLPIFCSKRQDSDAGRHVVYDFKISSPIAVVEQLYKDIFAGSDSFFGSTGSQFEKLKGQVERGGISISESKKQTLKLAEEGRIAWRETPVGGCTGTGMCKSYLMGEITDCLTESCTVISTDKVVVQIENLKVLLNRYEPDSHEYEMAEFDLKKLEKYKCNRIDTKNVG